MAHAEGSIVIDRPPQSVYGFLLDGANNLHWRSSVAAIERVAGSPPGVGAQFKQTLKGPGGRTIEGDYEVVEAVPNERIQFRVTAGPARPTGTYRLEPAGGSTRLSFELHFEPKGLARLMDPMITSSMRSEIAMLPQLKAYLEAHG